MNILIVHAGKGFYGGAEEVVTQLASYLFEQGHYVIVVTRKVPIEFFKKGNRSLQAYPSKSWWDMRGAVQEFSKRVDVINVHNFPATLAALPTKKPIVWMCNEPPELFTNWKRKPIEAFNRWWVRKSNMKVVVADEVQAEGFKRMYGVEPTVVPYGVDYEFWSQGLRKQRKEGPLRLLQIGTITPYKNQLESLCVLSELIALGKNATLTLAGSLTADPEYFKELSEYIKVVEDEFPDSRKRITFTGQITQEEIRGLYYTHDILLHPVKGQGGWLVPFEAMCAGLPVIVSPEFTGASLVKVARLGIVTGNYTKAVKHVVEPLDGGTISWNGQKEWVKENLTWEKYGEGMLKVFEDAIDGPGHN